MKGQVWTLVAVVWAAVWAWVDGALSVKRSSDPNTIMDSLGPVIPTGLIFGDPPDLANDVVGKPFDPNDSAPLDPQIAYDPVENPTGEDPILSAQRFEGDIILENEAELTDLLGGGRKGRNMVKDHSKKWPGGVVPYVVSSLYESSERKIIKRAMNSLQESSCISFVPRSNHQNYIHIIKSAGCSSSVGMKGGVQAVTLDKNCLYHGVVIHELMHALGLWHEHSRYDRDSHIKILFQNLAPKMEYNFEKYGRDKIETNGVPYDLESLMHYGEKAFAKDPTLKTIVALNGNSNMGQRRGMSVYDKKKLQIMYCDKNSVTGATQVSVGDCTNTHPDCEMWAMTKQCEENPSYMLVSCCKACRSRCKDRNSDCKAWAAKGECTKNANYMTAYCVESCGVCSSTTGGGGGGGGGGSGGGGGCTDNHKYCSAWKNSNQCAANPSYMLKECKKSCSVC
ncbi:zinc metalloproteinase nas-6-like isoform X2 [Portunus trituberculatus]|uniref:zinc metalloproteinase nas-6-like isoform X2 n=1 Tax=Portunus trituberculatus TaxID=210409 RepID=UPI001E1CCE91|nr:zinc metalloproteinase nas-6-like isoform X2 [Portunus trituberculatus]